MTEDQVIALAQDRAENHPTGIWILLGLILGPIGLILAYLMNPAAKVQTLTDIPLEHRDLYKEAYAEVARSRQRKSAWTGFALYFVLGFLVLIATCGIGIMAM